jgi:hypothetical protein
MRNFLDVASRQDISPDVRATLNNKIQGLHIWLTQQTLGYMNERQFNVGKAHLADMLKMIERFNTDPSEFEIPRSPYAPPGAPIGSTDEAFLNCSLH